MKKRFAFCIAQKDFFLIKDIETARQFLIWRGAAEMER
jgi:hypothetical protein